MMDWQDANHYVVNLFQSPRTGKFESNLTLLTVSFLCFVMFQSPRTGKFESNVVSLSPECKTLWANMFQSPRTGKFESNFNLKEKKMKNYITACFNPLERGNSNQIDVVEHELWNRYAKFQSPRTGKFESNRRS